MELSSKNANLFICFAASFAAGLVDALGIAQDTKKYTHIGFKWACSCWSVHQSRPNSRRSSRRRAEAEAVKRGIKNSSTLARTLAQRGGSDAHGADLFR